MQSRDVPGRDDMQVHAPVHSFHSVETPLKNRRHRVREGRGDDQAKAVVTSPLAQAPPLGQQFPEDAAHEAGIVAVQHKDQQPPSHADQAPA